jgi:hypothetical protein
MPVTKKDYARIPCIEIGPYQFETVHSFTYVGYEVNCKNDVSNNNLWRCSSDEPWPAEQPPLAVFPDCTRWYWVDM